MKNIPPSEGKSKRNSRKADQRATEKFLGMLFRDLPGQELTPGVPLYLCIWSTPSKIASFHLTVESAAAKVAELTEQGENVYFGCSLTAGKPEKGRGKLNNMGAVFFLWADIDFDDGTEAHKPKQGGKKILPNIKAAKEVLRKVGLPPSVITHSGHGLQAFWLLSEPILMKDEVERRLAAQFSESWVDTVRSCARARGWDLDPVHDLPRVLRAVGSVNVKLKNNPVPVKLLHPARGKPKVYDRGTVNTFIAPGDLSRAGSAGRCEVLADVDIVVPRELTKERKGELLEIIDGLCVNDPRFRKTWHRERKDLNDDSASGYDMAIASQMVWAECNEQDIADAIFLWRMRHKEDTNKAMRRKYMMDTIGKAKLTRHHELASERMVDIASSAPPRPPEVPETDEEKEQTKEWERSRNLVMDEVRRATGVNIIKLRQLGEHSDPVYSVVFWADGRQVEAVIGGARELLKFSAFRAAVLPFRVLVERMKIPVFENVIRSLVTFAEVVNEEGMAVEMQCEEWLQSFMTKRQCFEPDKDHENELQIRSHSYISGNDVYVHGQAFCQYVQLVLGLKLPMCRIRDSLRRLGLTSRRLQPVEQRQDGRWKTTRHYWVGPLSVLGDPAEEGNASRDDEESGDGASG